jgi:hypothetical protein
MRLAGLQNYFHFLKNNCLQKIKLVRLYLQIEATTAETKTKNQNEK